MPIHPGKKHKGPGKRKMPKKGPVSPSPKKGRYA